VPTCLRRQVQATPGVELRDNMKYEIDQSGKIEQTNRLTVVAFSNDKKASISLSTKDKKILQDVFRKANKPKMFSIQVFAALIFLLIKKYGIVKGKIIIDKEYPGHESLIKSYITQLINKSLKNNSKEVRIIFKVIGKSSDAHAVANKCFKKKKADVKADFKEILALILLYENA
jgi:hypothetical protein